MRVRGDRISHNSVEYLETMALSKPDDDCRIPELENET